MVMWDILIVVYATKRADVGGRRIGKKRKEEKKLKEREFMSEAGRTKKKKKV